MAWSATRALTRFLILVGTLAAIRDAAAEIPPERRVEFATALADTLAANREPLRQLLLEVDTALGANYELTQAEKTLRGVEVHELGYLQDTSDLSNVAVYGSTNIPLYTLIMHAYIPSMIARYVWFRTPERTRSLYERINTVFQPVLDRFGVGGTGHAAAETPCKGQDDKGLHLVDFVYEKYRKFCVLGANSNESMFLRGPADMVVFVGSPDTGRKIRDGNLAAFRDILQKQQTAPAPGTKSQKSSRGLTIDSFRQAFLMFGSGINPVVVTDTMSGKLQQPIANAVQSIKINNGQDCITPKSIFSTRALQNRICSNCKAR